MQKKLNINSKLETERMILVISIGITEALKNNLMSIEEAENCFFSLYTIKKLEDLGVDKDIIRLIYLGCELEDVESLIPDKLQKSIEDIRVESLRLLNLISRPDCAEKRWI